MKVFAFLLFFVSIHSVFSSGIREEKNSKLTSPEINRQTNMEMITLTGRVQIYGSEPHTFVGIIDENGAEYAIYSPEQEEKLRSLQGHLIEFTVVFLDEPQAYGSLFLKGGTVNPLEWNIIR
jgi:hypothetical protein